MKITAMNRVLRGWSNYYRAVNSCQQFRIGDFLAERLFQRWYCQKYQIGVGEYLSTVLASGRVVIQRGDVRIELFRMTSNRSEHTAMNHNYKRGVTVPVERVPELIKLLQQTGGMGDTG